MRALPAAVTEFCCAESDMRSRFYKLCNRAFLSKSHGAVMKRSGCTSIPADTRECATPQIAMAASWWDLDGSLLASIWNAN